MIFDDKIMVFDKVYHSFEALFKVSFHVIEIKFQLKFWLYEQDEQFQKFLYLSRYIFFCIFSMDFAEIYCHISLISFFIHMLEHKFCFFEQFSNPIIEFLYVVGFEGKNDQVIESFLEDSHRFVAENRMFCVENYKAVVLAELDCHLVLLVQEKNVLFQSLFYHLLYSHRLCLTDTPMLKIKDRNIALGYFLYNGQHFFNLHSNRKKHSHFLSENSFEPYIYALFLELLPQHEGSIHDEDETGLMPVEDAKAAVHIQKRIPAHDVQTLLPAHENVQTNAVGGDTDVVVLLHSLQLDPVNLHKDQPTYRIIADLHYFLEWVILRSLQVIPFLLLQSLVLDILF